MSIHMSIHIFYTCLYTCEYTCLCTHLYAGRHIPTRCPFAFLLDPIQPSMHMSTHMCTHLSLHMSTHFHTGLLRFRQPPEWQLLGLLRWPEAEPAVLVQEPMRQREGYLHRRRYTSIHMSRHIPTAHMSIHVSINLGTCNGDEAWVAGDEDIGKCT